MSSDKRAPVVVARPLGDEWIVIMEWPDGVTDGGPARLEIKPIGKMPVGGLSSTVLRRIDFRSAIDDFREALASIADDDCDDRGRSEVMQALRDFEQGQLRSAMSEGITREYLALLSWHYVQAVERGQLNINYYLADLVGKPVGTVRGHLIRARHDGLLSSTHGKKGGELSPEAEGLAEPYALAWLGEMDRLNGTSKT
ncbi:hypothetical protein [Mycolicibacterium neoaurum]|uniref:hypothetical protein n=1 Tax=Mycolicibacterium neoaurum TaxID=1795 RepID=UPI001F4CCEC5|nr:hypothetical protein [Mycolicibacterium neoaurum]